MSTDIRRSRSRGFPMAMELAGFLFGSLIVGGIGLAYISHERWKTIRAVYARDNDPRRNALIWPSR